MYTLITLLVFICAVTSQSGLEVRYALEGHPLNLECFSDLPKDEDIESYGWIVGSQRSPLREAEIEAYDDYGFGTNKGDLGIQKMTHEYTAYCLAKLKGETTETKRKEYSLKFGKIPTVTFSHKDDKVWNEGQNQIFTCETNGGIPPPNIKLLLDNEQLAFGNLTESISTEVQLTSQMNRKVLRCEVDNGFGLLNQTSTLNVTFAPRQVGKESKSQDNNSFVVKVTYKANPPPTNVWLIDSDCSHSNEPLPDSEITIKKEVEADTFSSSIKFANTENILDSNGCFVLAVNNSNGQKNFTFDLGSTSPMDGGLSTESIVGIVISSLLIIAILIGGAIFWLRKRRVYSPRTSGKDDLPLDVPAADEEHSAEEKKAMV